jgi:hypothetical protein
MLLFSATMAETTIKSIIGDNGDKNSIGSMGLQFHTVRTYIIQLGSTEVHEKRSQTDKQ